MSQDLKCYFGSHKFVIEEKLTITNRRGEEIGTSIVSRCENCGKIVENRFYTKDGFDE